MTLTEVENLLSVRLGFDVHTIGRHAVAAVIGQSMEESGCSDPASYARLLTTDPNAWDSLVDKVIVPETWFFRDTEPFNLISDRARAQMLRPTGGMFRILSCPCSTGEEAFSLAIAMLHAGARSESFTVDAVDVSKAALESAQAAVFRARSFRENDLIYHIPYFAPPDLSGLWRLNRDVAAMVRFRQGNLIAPDFLLEEAPYDLVLCRNLLIYLHSEARLLAIKALRRLVADDGVLVLGHAEAAFARDHGFKPVGHAAAFAFIKPSDSVIPKAQPAIRANPSSLARPQSPLVETIGAPALPGEPSTDVARPRPEADHSRLALARQLGDAGRLHEALQICSEYLKSAPASADGHFLLGVLHDALGHSDLAVSYFGKALYLDPSHRDALLHLALKREAAGDRASAALLRTRAHRTPEVSTAE